MQAPQTFPALLGDGQGRYRVHVIGNSGMLENILSRRNQYTQPLFS